MDSDVLELLIALIGGGIGVKILDWIFAAAKGRMDAAQKVQRRLDREVERRRAAERSLHIHQVALINAGVPEDKLPKLPPDMTTY